MVLLPSYLEDRKPASGPGRKRVLPWQQVAMSLHQAPHVEAEPLSHPGPAAYFRVLLEGIPAPWMRGRSTPQAGRDTCITHSHALTPHHPKH